MLSWFRRLRGAFPRRKPWLRSLPLRLERLEDRQVPSSFITEFSTPTSASALWDIAPGSDGALWFTEQGPAKIGRITASGTLAEYPLSAPFTAPTAITAGSDGALWFTDITEIGRITTAGSVTAQAIPGVDRQLVDIVTGPDGALWFTEQNNGANAIGRLTTSGSYTRYAVSTTNIGIEGITVGPDGAFWYSESNSNKIGRLSTAGSGSVTEYTIPTTNSGPLGITAGPDGALWFAESAAGKIGRLTTSGVFTEYSIPTANSGPLDVVTGSDGALWFTESLGNKLGRLTTSGAFFEYSIPTSNALPTGMAAGPGGSIWFMESSANKAGRFLDVPPSATGVPVNAVEGQLFSGTAATFTDTDPNATASDFSATISWGDGHTGIGTITANGSGGFNVSGLNTYAEDGSYTVSVIVTDYLGGSGTATSTASAADAWLSATGMPITAMEGSVFNGSVATFTDGNPLAAVGDFSATISWGDGHTSSGTITQNAGTFTVSGSNAYAEAGAYAVQVSIQDNGSSASTTKTATITDASLSASGRSASAVEGSVFSGVLATFTDGNPLSMPADISATVTWGDGQTSTATISLNAGVFSVSASHAWAEAGSYTIQVSILDAQGSTASTSAAATISDAALSASGQSFGVQEGASYSGVLATFTDGNPLSTLADLSATVTWGDGQTSTATISQNAGVFSVSSSHTYAEAASYTVQVSIHDVEGSTASPSATATISDAPLTAWGRSFSAQEGAAYNGVVATFTDANALATAADFSATITWGDGQTGTASVSVNAGVFSVSAAHAYAEAGSYTVQVSIQDAQGSSASPSATAAISDAALSATGQGVSVQEGTPFNGVVATLTDANALATSADLSATITWGDGQTSTGTITQNVGVFSVSASHTYAEAGSYTVQVAVHDAEGSNASTSTTATVFDAALTATGQSGSVQEGSLFSGAVATFTDANPLATAADLSATVHWGDGQTGTGTISLSGGTFSVSASHAWAEAGSYTIQVSILDAQGSTASTSAAATISDAALSATGQSFGVQEGTSYSGVLATFTDGNPLSTTADFSATATWGDGQTSTATISQNAGVFSVSSSHTYAEAASYTVQVSIHDVEGSTASPSATATISDAALGATGHAFSVQEGSFYNGVLATFTDANRLATVGDFNAAITWGDGQTSTGSISLSAGVFTVSASHAYAEAGSYTVQISIQDAQGSSTSTSAAATISDAALSATAQAFSVREGSSYNGVVATFTDANPLATVGDFSATITWGDGQTSTGSISLNAGVFSVSASHAYAEAGSYTGQISILDAHGSSASVPATASVSDAALSIAGQPLSVQEGSAFSGAVATFTDANPLATTSDFSATIAWGDGHTSVGSITQSGGVFSVSGSYTYAEAGSYTVQISVSDVQGSTGSATAAASISDAALSATASTFAAPEGTAFNGAVATFTDANSLSTASDFTATLNWGDGHTSTASITVKAGTYTASSSHAYAEAGSYTVQISIHDVDGSSASTTATASISDAVLSASGQSFGVQEGSAFGGVVATFTDANALATPVDFSATITWGDGQTSTGSITQNATVFSVSANHIYAEAGSYSVLIAIRDVEGSTASPSATATVSDAPLTATGQPFVAQEGSLFSGTIATFTDANPLATTADFHGTISWGDGQSGTASITENAGVFSVSASHAYVGAGSYTVQVSIQDVEGSATTASAIAAITNAPLNAAAQSFTAEEGSPRTGVVGTFTDANLLATSADFTATLIWGDGQTSSGNVTGSAGRFSVSASHVYAGAGSYTFQFSVRDANRSSASASAAATVSDAILSPAGGSFAAQEGSLFSGVVASFTDANPLATTANFTATVDWGDGHTTTGVVSASGGVFSVTAAHTFSHAGSYTPQVAIDDVGGSTATALAGAVIADAPLHASGLPISLQEGSVFSDVAASFTDGNALATAGDFTATIAWGDGQTAAGSITMSQGSFVVSGSHTYAVAGSFDVIVIVVDNAGASATSESLAAITPASIVATAEPVSGVAGRSFTGLVATFTPKNLGGSASNYQAVISWGDGSTTTGIVSADPGGGFDVRSAHTYAQPGRKPLTVTIRGPGGAAVTVAGTAVVAPAGSLQVIAGTVSATNSILYSGAVASFSDPTPGAQPSDYIAIISWGDGSTSPGTIVPDGHGGYDITGSYQYANPGAYSIQVTIRDRSGASTVVTANAHVAQFNEIPPTAPPPISAIVSTSLAGQNSSANPMTTIATVSASRAASASNFPVVVNVDNSAPDASSKPEAPHVPPPRPKAKTVHSPDSAGPATPTADPPRRAASGFDQHTSILSNKLLVAELDAMAMGMQARAIRVQDVAVGVGLVASAGYVVWALRNSYFLTSLLAATPLWRQFDPLAVLDLWEGKRPRWFPADDDDDEEESLESLVERNARHLAAQSGHERKSP